MCGIAGFIDPGTTAETRQDAVGRMCAHMLHRGPDDFGIETSACATIGMRRLAIFDPANGRQPMVTPDGRFHLVFNGAIYNFRELRQQLASAGASFHTECDTEVLLAAFAQWREGCLDRLRGMFAFAAWDSHERTLFLARDPFGIKPLYYRHDGEQLLFASELGALLASGIFSSEIDPVAVADYLAWLAVPAPRTIYRGVFSLRPGESAVFRDGDLEIRSTWNFRTVPAGEACRSPEEFERELRSRLENSIAAHLAADVPVGAFLSGGLDSGVVAGLMSRAAGGKLKTFTIGFGESGFDESSDAENTARHLGTDHVTRILSGSEVARDLPALLSAFDQPTGDGINTYYASQTARAGGVTVALSGLGGDELFGGYPSFRDIPRLARLLPAWHTLPGFARAPILARLRRRDSRSRKLADILQHARNFSEICAMQRRVLPESRRHQLLSSQVRETLGSSSPYHPELAALSADLDGVTDFPAVSAWELRTYMADVLLRDTDVMSMRHSLEMRVPFVDRPLIEWLWQQPARYKLDLRQPKSALYRAVRDILPPHGHSRRKQGFTLPFAHWMRAELRPFLETTFSSGSINRSGMFSRDDVQQLWQGFLGSDDAPQWSRVWSVAIMIDFANRPPVTPLRPRPWPLEVRRPASPPPAHVVSSRSLVRASRARRRSVLLAPEIFRSEGGITRILQIYLKALCDLAAPQDAVRLVALNDEVVDSRDLRRAANERLTEWRVCSGRKARFVRDALALSAGAQTLVFGHVAQLPIALAAKARNPRLRYYVVAHGIEVWRPFTFAERLALRGAERVLCVSDYTRRELLRHCPLRDGRAVVLPNALDPFFRIAPGLPRGDRPPSILVVTRLTFADRYKGVEHMIDAMPAIRAQIPHATLRIIGRGDDLPRLQQRRNALGLHSAIEFLGFVDDRRMAEELRSCTLFALPSEREGFGLVFLEAMANGRPCLGARAGGIPEVITPESGVLAPYGDVAAIANAAVQALRREWNEAAILDRAREFSYSRFKDRLGSLLHA